MKKEPFSATQAGRAADPLRTAIEQAPFGVAVFDRDMRYLAASKRYLAELDLPAEDVVGRLHYEIFPQLAERWGQVIQRVLAGEALEVDEELVTRANGRRDWVRWSLTPWREQAGPIGGLILYVEVITPRIEQRRALQAAEARFRGVFDQAAVGMARVSAKGRFLEVNQRFCEIAGYSHEELLQLSFQKITHPDDLQNDIGHAEALLARKISTYSLEKRYIRKDGEVAWIALTVSLAPSFDGGPDDFVSVIQDISKRRAAEAALRGAEARSREQLEELEAIYESSPVGLAFLTPDLVFVRVNRRLAEMNGLPAADHIGRGVAEVAPSIAAQAKEIRDRIIAGEQMVSYEITGETAAAPGARGSWLEYWVPLQGEDGKLRGFNVVVEDITERKQAESRRKLLIDELNHRVRNTLAVVQSIARQTFSGHNAPAHLRDAFEDRLHALAAAHSILTREEWQSADLREVVAAAASSQAARRMSLEGPPVALPPAIAVALSLALHELGTNASKYGALSGEAGRVEVRWSLDAPGGRILKLRWEEVGGPTVTAPQRRGFGTRMLERALRAELGGTVRLDFAREGVVCELEARLDRSG